MDGLVDIDRREGERDELSGAAGTVLGWRGGRKDMECPWDWWVAGRMGTAGGSMVAVVSVAATTGCAGRTTAAVVPVVVEEGSVVARTERTGPTGETTDDTFATADTEVSAGLLTRLLDLLLLPLAVPVPAAAAAAAAASSCCFRNDGSTLMCTLDRSTTGWLGRVRSSTL